MNFFTTSLRENPELALFLTLALGFVVGRFSIGSFKLGNVVGTLLAGLLIGQLGIDVPPIVKAVFFDLFLFATGYKVGPQFFRGLGKSALPQVALAVVVCVTCLLTAYLTAKIFGFDAGIAAGMMAGAFGDSAIIGTASNAITRLNLPPDETKRLLNNLPMAYAVTYLVGTTLSVWFLTTMGPRLLRADVAAESKKMEEELGGGVERDDGPVPAYREWDFRAYRLKEDWAGRSVGDLEKSFAPERVFVERVRQDGHVVDAEPATVLSSGGAVALVARRRVVSKGVAVGSEIDDRELLDFPVTNVNVVVTNKSIVNRTIEELAKEYGRAVALRRLVRGGEEIPFEPRTRVNRGDLLELAGPQEDVERASKALGYVQGDTTATDIVFLGLGITIGGLLGLLSVTVGGVPITLTTSGGALIMGLVFGWLRSMYPTFGGIPEAALWLFDTLGLAVFIGVVGLAAAPSFLDGLRRAGLTLLLVGALLAVIPFLVALLFGTYVLKMNPVLLMGATAGAGTSTPALRAVQDVAQSKVPVLGYTVPYAIAAIIMAAWGPVIVMLIH
ncbi:MAG TPA: aspartate-alanine antiporter [Gemmatimonadaceae bacterium]